MGNGANESDVFLDDTRLQDLGWRFRISSEEPGLPELRNRTVTVSGRHGHYDFGAYFGAREFLLDAVLERQPTYADISRKLGELKAELLDAQGRPKTRKLRFGDAVDRYFNVRLSGALTVERVERLAIIKVPLTAADPHAYSPVTTDEVTWGSEIITFDWNYLLGHEGGGGAVRVTAPTTQSVTISGQAVKPVITLSGAGANVRVAANGRAFTLDSLGGATWVVDCEEETVTRNGVARFDALVGDFIGLLPGGNVITITGTGLNFDLTVKARDKYM